MTLTPKLRERIEAKAQDLVFSRDAYCAGADALYEILGPVIGEMREALELADPWLREGAEFSRWNGNFLFHADKCKTALARLEEMVDGHEGLDQKYGIGEFTVIFPNPAFNLKDAKRGEGIGAFFWARKRFETEEMAIKFMDGFVNNVDKINAAREGDEK